MKLLRFWVRRRVLVSMIYAAVALFALAAGRDLSIDLFPELEPPVLSVVTAWPGASAEDMEDLITDVLEDELSTVTNLDEMNSTSRDNLSLITLVFDFDQDLDAAANEVRDAIEDVAAQLPEGSERPRLVRMKTAGFPAYIFALRSRTGDAQPYAERIEDEVAESLRRVPGAGAVTVYGAPENQVRVDLDPRELEARGMTLPDVLARLAAVNVSVPAGFLELGPTEYSVRVPARFGSLDEIEALPIGSGPRGEVIYVRDVAEVRLGPADAREATSVDGAPAVLVAVQKASGANTLELVEGVRERLRAARDRLPADLEVVELLDGAELIVAMVDSLLESVALGGLFVVLSVLLFVQQLRPALIITVQIPVSMLMVLLGMAAGGYSLNVVTLISMALCIGMVVDNSIVVLESIIFHRQRGESPADAAVKGTAEVAGAVFGSTLTSVVIFGPLVLIGNIVGIFFGQLAFVATSALVSSLVTSLVLTPMMAGWLLRDGDTGAGSGRVTRAFEHMLERLHAHYGRLVRAAIRHPIRVLTAAGAMVAATVAMGQAADLDLVPKIDSGDVDVFLTLRPGATVEETMAVGRRLEERLLEEPDVLSVRTHAGESMSGTTLGGGQEGSHIVLVSARMVPPERRSRTDGDLAVLVRGWVRAWPEPTAVSVRVGNPIIRSIEGGTSPVYIRVETDDASRLPQAVDAMVEALRTVEGVAAPSSQALATKPELRIEIARGLATEHGAVAVQVATTVRAALTGLEVGRVELGDDDLPLWVRAGDDAVASLGDLAGLAVPTLTGRPMPLHGIATLTDREGPIEHLHRDKRRFAAVEADLEGRPLGAVIADIEEALARADLPPGTRYSFGGEVERQAETKADLQVVMVLSLCLLVMVLAGQFESFVDTGVILLAIPFAFTGTFFFLLLFGVSITLFAFLGLIILMGIVVNNSIVLVECVHSFRDEGDRGDEAVARAAERRLRPVLMTTLTTIAGMIPLATSRGLGHELWQPIGITVSGGLAVSTLVTLVLVPTAYAAVERRRMRREAPAAGA